VSGRHIDPFSQQMMGWLMQPHMKTELVAEALCRRGFGTAPMSALYIETAALGAAVGCIRGQGFPCPSPARIAQISIAIWSGTTLKDYQAGTA
jgi:hypothetical protein